MSEELLQTKPVPLGRYLYYKLGNSTLDQLKRHNVIRQKVSTERKTKKPDGLVVTADGIIKALIEYKTPDEIKTKSKLAAAIAQEIDVAKDFCKILIVTDGSKSFWINPLTKNPILNENGKPVSEVFSTIKILNGLDRASVLKFEDLLDQIDHSLSEKNDQIVARQLLDPSPLAKALWQKIWINTGKEPEKCLYNVVELFVFKFLSDLNVLKTHHNFSAIYSLSKNDAQDALELYASGPRKEIRKLFPPGDDQTTVINGTIFVNEKGEANSAQAQLFGEVLTELNRFGEKYGSFRYIQRDFKTRLYESFLRQSAGIKSLGQYFTPRNVIRAMVSMSSASTLKTSARICDPFCGVGGFLLETLADNPHIQKTFEPKNGAVNSPFTLVGYDKGSDEKEDERTIILAKANMLIYFSDLVAKHHTQNDLFSFSKGAFNKVFNLLRTNLGTFEKIDEEPYDLILTNPPYVTSGVSSLRKAIEAKGLEHYYTVSGRGTEALAIEWIVSNLKHGGEALVVVPDGLMIQKGVIEYLAKNCFIDAIVSLPSRTFYATAKKTFILVLTKKPNVEDEQEYPVFTYLISEIGESRDSFRVPIEENDLTEMVSFFRQFRATPHKFAQTSSRLKFFSIDHLKRTQHLLVDRWWSDEEKKSLGITTSKSELSEADFYNLMNEIAHAAEVPDEEPPEELQYDLDDMLLFEEDEEAEEPKHIEYVAQKTGWSTKQYRELDTKNPKDIPVYSAAKAVVAYVNKKTDKLIDATPQDPVISFASDGDGSAGGNVIFHTCPFYVSNSRICIKITANGLLPEFAFISLQGMRDTYGFDYNLKANKKNLAQVRISIPLDESGSLDIALQERLVSKYNKLSNLREKIEASASALFSGRLTISSLKG